MLFEWIIYGFAIYGFVSLWVQVIKRAAWWHNHRKQEMRMVIFVYNSENYIEHLYRSLISMSKTTGRPLDLTFIDCGSSDDTVKMLRLLSKKDDHVHVIEEQGIENACTHLLGEQNDHTIVVDLRPSTT